MPTILVETMIYADILRVFDLSRSIDLHSISTIKTQEKATSGCTSGLINLNETVTWEATHFGVRQKLTSQITAMERPYYFRDEMLKGAFKSIYHEHIFEEINSNTTKMIDKFKFESPCGIIGKIFNQLVLTKYMTRFLTDRNKIIKEYAESSLGDALLHVNSDRPSVHVSD